MRVGAAIGGGSPDTREAPQPARDSTLTSPSRGTREKGQGRPARPQRHQTAARLPARTAAQKARAIQRPGPEVLFDFFTSLFAGTSCRHFFYRRFPCRPFLPALLGDRSPALLPERPEASLYPGRAAA